MQTLERWAKRSTMSCPPSKKPKTESCLSQAELLHRDLENYDPANPPMRPRSKAGNANDSFLMDFENSCLEDFTRVSDYDNVGLREVAHWEGLPAFPKGRDRWKDPAWAKHIKSQVYPFHSDVDWKEYVAWVSGGGGDEWFVEE